jgi:hypothetical protein
MAGKRGNNDERVTRMHALRFLSSPLRCDIGAVTGRDADMRCLWRNCNVLVDVFIRKKDQKENYFAPSRHPAHHPAPL